MLDQVRHGKGKATQGLVGLFLFLILSFIAAMTVALPVKSAPASPPDHTITFDQTRAPVAQGSQTPTIIAHSAKIGAGAQQLYPKFSLPAQPIVDANTVALYHFDSATGNIAVDATGNHNATLYGNAGYTAQGLYGGALQLDGRDGPGSYLRTGNLGPLDSGTIEAYVDFATACAATDVFGIFSAGGEFGAGQSTFWLGDNSGFLAFKVWVDNKLYVATSSINPCRYLDGNGNKDPYFVGWGLPVERALWPYETWRFHHVAATWGPRGIEIWVDGVLHGVGVGYGDPNVPPNIAGKSCSPQDQLGSKNYPNCDFPSPGLVAGSYAGGLTTYDTFLVGCDSDAQCFKGRIDEVRISNIQRTFSTSIIPASTPTPTQTPVPLTGEYSVDPQTIRLYHLNSIDLITSRIVYEASGNNAIWRGNPALVPGIFGNALALDGNSYFDTGLDADPLNGTIEAWVSPNSALGPYGIASYGSAAEMGQGRSAFFFGVPTASGNLRFGIISADGQWHWVDSGISAQQLLDGCWHHVAGTWGAFGLEIWVDGILQGRTDYYDRVEAQPNPAWVFGCAYSGTAQCMRGRIDEVRLSSVRRSFSPRVLAARLQSNSGVRFPVAGTPLFLPLIQSGTGASSCQFGN